MGTFILRLSESLHQQAKMLAQQEGVSVNQLIATALAEKVSALHTVAYLEERAKRGSRQAFDRALNKVKEGSADAEDTLEN